METLKDEPSVDMSPWIRQRITELTETIEAIQAIASSSYWKVLEKNIFEGLLQAIDKKLRNEKDEKEICRLQGQAIWAMKYCDFSSLEEAYRKELSGLNEKLNGQ